MKRAIAVMLGVLLVGVVVAAVLWSSRRRTTQVVLVNPLRWGASVDFAFEGGGGGFASVGAGQRVELDWPADRVHVTVRGYGDAPGRTADIDLAEGDGTAVVNLGPWPHGWVREGNLHRRPETESRVLFESDDYEPMNELQHAIGAILFASGGAEVGKRLLDHVALERDPIVVVAEVTFWLSLMGPDPQDVSAFVATVLPAIRTDTESCLALIDRLSTNDHIVALRAGVRQGLEPLGADPDVRFLRARVADHAEAVQLVDGLYADQDPVPAHVQRLASELALTAGQFSRALELGLPVRRTHGRHAHRRDPDFLRAMAGAGDWESVREWVGVETSDAPLDDLRTRGVETIRKLNARFAAWKATDIAEIARATSPGPLPLERARNVLAVDPSPEGDLSGAPTLLRPALAEWIAGKIDSDALMASAREVRCHLLVQAAVARLAAGRVEDEEEAKRRRDDARRLDPLGELSPSTGR